jgi:hypothetical protein
MVASATAMEIAGAAGVAVALLGNGNDIDQAPINPQFKGIFSA